MATSIIYHFTLPIVQTSYTIHMKLNYIVQYVSFKTEVSPGEFIDRWTPFADSFKRAGTKTIDLYQVQDNKNINYISRNIWEENIYFQNFPSGIAHNGSGGGVSVTQLGGFWIDIDHILSKDVMKLAFLSLGGAMVNSPYTARLNCTIKGLFKQMLDIPPELQTDLLNEINCSHLRQM